MEQLAQPVLKDGSKKIYADEWPDRFAQMQIARNKAEQEQAKADDTAEKLAYKEAEEKTLAWFVAGNNTKEEVDTAVQMFIETYGKVPQSVLTYQKNYTLEARAKAKQIEAIESIPFGFIRQADVDAMSTLDANKGRELDRRYAEQERRYGKGTFAEISKGFKKTAFGTTKLGTIQTGDANGILVLTAMQGEYRRRVDERMASAGDNSDATFNTIAQQVGIELENEVKTGLLNKDSKWYRSVDSKGRIKFPGLNTGTVPTAKQAEDNLQGIKDRIAQNGGGEGGLEKTLDTAGAIITAQEAADILRNYDKPGFVIPRDVMFVARLGNGTDPFTIINRQLKALNLIELVPPQISQDIESTFTPQEKRDLYDIIGGPRQRLRALETGSVRQTGAVNRFQRPATMRTTFKRSFTGAMTYEDNSQEYVTTGKFLESIGFQVREHPDFGGTAPVHAGNSYHGYGEAFDITHQTGDYDASIEKTRQLKEAIRSLGLFEEVIGPGDWDPNAPQDANQLMLKKHSTHLHVGGLMRPMTPEDIEKLNSLLN